MELARRNSLKRIRKEDVYSRFSNGNPDEKRRGLSRLFRGVASEGENFLVIGLIRFWTALVEDISFWLVDKVNLTQGVLLPLDLVRFR